MKYKLCLLALFFLNFSVYSQSPDPNLFTCGNDVGSSSGLGLGGCSYTSDYPWSLSDFYPSSSSGVKTLKLRFIVIQNPNKIITKTDATYSGNFVNNSEVQKFFTDIINSLNSSFGNLVTDAGCTAPVITDSKIRVQLAGVTYVSDATGNVWANYNSEECPGTESSTTSWDANQYLTNSGTELNVFFTEEPSHFDYFVLGTGTDISDGRWCAATRPGYPNASSPPTFSEILKVNARGVFTGFYYDKYTLPNGTLYWNSSVTNYDSPLNTYWWGVNGTAWGLLHEIGHNLGLHHINGCSNIMDDAGSAQRHYLTSDQIGIIQKVSSLQSTRNYIIHSYDNANPINITLANDDWNYDIKTYNDIIIKNGSVLNINCNVLMPQGSKIVIESGGKLIVNDDAEIALGLYGYIQVNSGGTLEINNTVPSKGIVFDQSATNYVLVKGTLKFGSNADFTLQGKGYYKFSGNPSLILSSTSEVNLLGPGQGNTMLIFDDGVVITIDGNPVTIKTGNLSFYNNAFLKVHNTSLNFYDITISGNSTSPTGNKGIWANEIITKCDIKYVDFLNLETGIEIKNIDNPLVINVANCTFSNCKTAIKGLQLDKMVVKSSSLENDLHTGSVGLILTNCKNVKVDGGTIHRYEKAIDLSNIKAFYVDGARIYDCGKAIYGIDSKVWMRNGAEIDYYTTPIEMYGNWNSSSGNYSSMLTMGDAGCASIINYLGSAILGENTILALDPTAFDVFPYNVYNHLWFYPDPGNSSPIIDMCYTSGTKPTSVDLKRNLWCAAGAASNPAPSGTSFHIPNSYSCIGSNMTLNITPTSVCIPSTYDCSICNESLKGASIEDDELSPDIIVKEEFVNDYSSFLLYDSDSTRQNFDDLSILELRYDTTLYQWYITSISGVEFPADDSTANLIMVSKIIYEASDSIYNEKISPRIIKDIFSPYYSHETPGNQGKNELISIFPNPTQGTINIKLNFENEINRIMIIDIFGKRIYDQSITTALTIDMAQDKKGVYFIMGMKSDGSVIEVQKVILQ